MAPLAPINPRLPMPFTLPFINITIPIVSMISITFTVEVKTLKPLKTLVMSTKKPFTGSSLKIQTMSTKGNSPILSHFKVIYIKNATDIGVADLSHASLILLVNVPLMTFIIFCKNLREKKSHLFFLNILIVHIMCSLIIIIISNLTSNAYMRIYTILNIGLLIEMFESMILLTCERLAAIKYPFNYADITGKHIMLILVSSWLPVAAFVCLAIKFNVPQETCTIVSTILILFAAITSSTANVIIYFIAKKHDIFMKENAQRNNRNTTKVVKMLKASFVCFAVVASFVVLWLPYFVHNLLLLSSIYVPKDDREVFTKVVDHIAYLHSMVDPIIFIWLSKAIKEEMKKLLKIWKQPQERPPANITSQDTAL